ncbi:hypothetical protein QO015_004286 [Kaistia geumhonensis]|uniref:Uncharacterized protein n=1 Tax=Kaistia geumhonensis TaxID=410839 RepID=A0ABU0MCK7_9HYPH|nr:hypothetical protein [Kaistia geumhonensis]
MVIFDQTCARATHPHNLDNSIDRGERIFIFTGP